MIYYNFRDRFVTAYNIWCSSVVCDMVDFFSNNESETSEDFSVSEVQAEKPPV